MGLFLVLIPSSATAMVAEVFPPTAMASATAKKVTYGRPLVDKPSIKIRYLFLGTELLIPKLFTFYL